MQVKNHSDMENRSSTISENSQPELRKSSSVSKIIDSYELLLSCCNKRIAQLTTDLQLTREKLQITETRYSTLIDHLDDRDRANVDKLTDKVDELEKKLISKNAEIVRLKAKILTGEKDINQQKTSSFEKGNINKFFNFECIRENQLIIKRQRRNSVQEQQNSHTWQRAFDQFNSEVESPTKFKLKTTSMLKKFIPHQQRAKIWPYVFQNQLGITTNLYIQLLERRSKDTIETHVISQIHRDIVRSFNSKVDMGDKEIIGSEVQQILEIFHLLRPDVSYVQGMTYPALVLTIVVGKIQAFKIFSNLILCNKFFRNMYSFEEKAIEIYCKVFQILLNQSLPEVGRHIKNLNISPQLFLIQWFFTIFSRGLSMETTLKIWDLLGYQKQLLLYKLCLSIFELIEKNLLSYRYEESIGLIQSYWANIDENKLLQLVLSCKLTNEKLGRVFMKVAKQVHGTSKRVRRESLILI